MLELQARGPASQHRRQTRLEPGQTYVLGRDDQVEIAIDWDPLISRRHLELVADQRSVTVRRLPEARNPLFYAGAEITLARISIDEQFVVGSTVFRVALLSETPGATAVEERAYSPQQLRRVRYQDPENRIAVLTRLPEVIGGALNDRELHERLANLLLRGIVHAEAVAIVSLGSDDSAPLRMRHWERRHEIAGEVRPSRRLVEESLQRQRTSILHIWHAEQSDSTAPTLGQEFDWAYCTPVEGLAEGATGLYVTGQASALENAGDATLAEQFQLEGDVKFTELVAEIIGAVRKAQRLERQKAGLRQFFAPPILTALGDEFDTTLLEPSECDVTVLFCDLRGFSQRAEEEADNLIGLLERVSQALGVMTRHILAYGGVTADFQGDAALGFWGWPLASTTAPLDACRAALEIRSAFLAAAADPEHPLADFSVGIGIAHGRAVAGKIGTSEQVKVTVFGPVVNLAHRLEGMTKMIRAPILLDEASADLVRQRLNSREGRVRTIARVLPYGMAVPTTVSELVPPAGEQSELTDAQIAIFEKGVENFCAGRWQEAYQAFHAMPASDSVPDFLLQRIMQTHRIAPPHWDGVLRLPGK